jgi:TPR repeat protein
MTRILLLISLVWITAAASGCVTGKGSGADDIALNQAIEKKDWPEIVRLSRQMAQAGQPGGYFNLGRAFELGKGVDQNLEEAKKNYQKAIDGGYDRARAAMGHLLVTEKKYDEAKALTEPCAQKGVGDCQYLLGGMYESGLGVPQDDGQARGYYLRAAEKGVTSAQTRLGMLLLKAEDYPNAWKWLQKGAEKKHPMAHYYLGVILANGLGQNKNEAEAVVYYRKAAEKGLPEAQYNLAVALDQGQGVAPNMNEAWKWFNEAAAGGDPRAQVTLASVYETGRAAPKDVFKAYAWYSLASTAKDPDAARLGQAGVRRLGPGLSPEQKETAERAVHEWKPKRNIQWDH